MIFVTEIYCETVRGCRYRAIKAGTWKEVRAVSEHESASGLNYDLVLIETIHGLFYSDELLAKKCSSYEPLLRIRSF
jgi:hypothetical protein